MSRQTLTGPMILGKYELRRELGRGSMGVVHEAFDTLIRRVVAIKVIRTDRLEGGSRDGLVDRLRREAQAAGRLNHPGIVGIHDFGEQQTDADGHTAFVVMEYVEGRDLARRFALGERFAESGAAALVGDILSALQHAHERGVVHRDIKPGNIIVLDDGSVKIADFGIARIDASDLTQTGTVIGTPTHMAPEQWLGRTADARTDLFACGVLLYQLLTHELPFDGSPATVMHRILNQDPVPSTVLNPRLGAGWDDLLRRALARNPADRFQSAKAMSAALHATLTADDRDVTVVLPSTQRVDEGQQPAAPPQAAEATKGSRVGVVAGFVAIVAVALSGYFGWPYARPGSTRVESAMPATGAALPGSERVQAPRTSDATDSSPAAPAGRSDVGSPVGPGSGHPPIGARVGPAIERRTGSTVGPPSAPTIVATRVPKPPPDPPTSTPIQRPFTPVQGVWRGTLHCSEILHPAIHDVENGPFKMGVRIDVADHAITWDRSNASFVESLSGQIDDAGHWRAIGQGRRLHQGGAWQTFATGIMTASAATPLTGAVSILSSSGQMARRCTIEASPERKAGP